MYVPFARFEENCAKTWTFSSTPFMRENHVLVHGTEKGFSVVVFNVLLRSKSGFTFHLY